MAVAGRRRGGTEAKTETITIGVPSLQEAFVDPHWAVGGLIFPLLWAISESLYTPNQDNKYVPNLATGFDLSDDKLTWTFHLRDGVKMQDGSAFTANDVKTAVDRVVGERRVHPPGELQVVRHRRHCGRSADGRGRRRASRTPRWSST